MDSTLLAHIRFLLEDSAEVVSDEQIENLSKTRRRLLYYEPLLSEDMFTWYHSRRYIEAVGLYRDYEGAELSGYTADPIEGSWTFPDAQASVCVRGFAYDLRDIVSRCWLAKAGLIDAFPGLAYSLGDESVDKSKTREYCISQYWRYKTSKGSRLCRR
jgi:hypothetical protein